MQFKLASCSEPTTITRQKTIDGLTAMGWKAERNPPSRKYIYFTKPGIEFHLLIGKSGALRKVANGGTVATSLSMTGGRIHAATESWRQPHQTTIYRNRGDHSQKVEVYEEGGIMHKVTDEWGLHKALFDLLFEPDDPQRIIEAAAERN